jgi:hypothetical protein
VLSKYSGLRVNCFFKVAVESKLNCTSSTDNRDLLYINTANRSHVNTKPKSTAKLNVTIALLLEDVAYISIVEDLEIQLQLASK